MGKIKTISASNNKKIKIILKNWIENGDRGVLKGLNPHSKENSFSFLLKVFFLKRKIEFINIIIIIITRAYNI